MPPLDIMPVFDLGNQLYEANTHDPSMEHPFISFCSNVLSTSSITPTSSPMDFAMNTSTVITRPLFTQAMIYHMYSLSRLVDVRATRVEKDVPRVINNAIKHALDLLRDMMTRFEWLVKYHGVRFDNLTARLEALQKDRGSSSLVDIMKGKLSTLQADMSQW